MAIWKIMVLQEDGSVAPSGLPNFDDGGLSTLKGVAPFLSGIDLRDGKAYSAELVSGTPKTEAPARAVQL